MSEWLIERANGLFDNMLAVGLIALATYYWRVRRPWPGIKLAYLLLTTPRQKPLPPPRFARTPLSAKSAVKHQLVIGTTSHFDRDASLAERIIEFQYQGDLIVPVGRRRSPSGGSRTLLHGHPSPPPGDD